MLAMERHLVGLSLMLKIRLGAYNNLGSCEIMLKMRMYACN
jgi:hypothetical protein